MQSFPKIVLSRRCLSAAVILVICYILALDIIRMCFLGVNGFPVWQTMSEESPCPLQNFFENYDRHYFLFLVSSEGLVRTGIYLGFLLTMWVFNHRYSKMIALGGSVISCSFPKERNLGVLKIAIWACAIGGCIEIIGRGWIVFRLWNVCPQDFPYALDELVHIALPAISTETDPVPGTVIKICCELKSLALIALVYPTLICATYRLRENGKSLRDLCLGASAVRGTEKVLGNKEVRDG